MKMVTIKTDVGIVLTSYRSDTSPMFDTQRESVSSISNGQLYTIQLQMGQTLENHTRNYRKLFYFVAQIGGFVKAFLLIGWLYQPFLKRKYYIDLINHLYSVDGGEGLKEGNVWDSALGEFVHGIVDKQQDNKEKDDLIVWRKFDFFGEQKAKEDIIRKSFRGD